MLYYALGGIVTGAAFFVLGAIWSRWYALLIPALVWTTWIVLTDLTEGFEGGDWPPEAVVVVLAITVLLPWLLMAAAGVVVGQARRRGRTREELQR
jgi:hypothetical protein